MSVDAGSTAGKRSGRQEPPSFAGTWTYRSFNNEPAPDGDPGWWVAQIELEHDASGIVTGQLAGITSPETFDLVGYVDDGVLPGDHTWWQERLILVMRANGANPETAGHTYEYRGYYPGFWPAGKDQFPAIVGSVLRARFPDDPSFEGEVRSFAAVRSSGAR